MVLKKPSGEVTCLSCVQVTRIPDPLSIFLCQRALELSFWSEVGIDRFVETPALEHAGDLEALFHYTKQDSDAPGWDEPADILANRRPEGFKAILAGERKYRFIERSQSEATDRSLKTAGLFRQSGWLIHADTSSRSLKMPLTSEALGKLAKAAVIATSLISPLLKPGL